MLTLLTLGYKRTSDKQKMTRFLPLAPCHPSYYFLLL